MEALPRNARSGGKLRLLWLIDSLTMGGAESLVLPFAAAAGRHGYELSVCCLKTIDGNPIESELRSAGVKVWNLGARNLRDRSAFRRLIGHVRSNAVDLIHSHLTYASIWGSLISRATGIPLVATIHVAPPARVDRSRLLDRLMRLSLHHWSRQVIAVSHALRKQYLRTGGLDAAKITVVHNGIDVRAYDVEREQRRLRARRELGYSNEDRVITTVSVLRPGKGIDVLIEAVASLARTIPAARLLVVGDGPCRDDWTNLAAERGIGEIVRWSGHRRDVPALLHASDLFVLPSLGDAFPTVLLEAMAARLPLVASAVGGIVEIVEPERTGMLVPPGEPAALAAAIAELLADPERMRRMGIAGRELVERQFSIDQWIERLDRVYRHATSGDAQRESA